jgi:hypothetical protein
MISHFTVSYLKRCVVVTHALICFFFFLLLFISSHVHTLFGSFLYPVPPPWPFAPPTPFPPFPPQFQAGPVLPLSLILLKKRHKHKKEDKAVLLVELRIAIQRDSYYCSHVPMWYNPCRFNLFLYLPYVLSPCHVIQVQPHCCICLRFKVRIWGRTYHFWSSELGWPCSEWYSPVPSIYLQMIRFHFSSWLSKIPLCTSTTFSWSIYQ